VLCEFSEMCFGTVDCDDAHCYTADGTVRWWRNVERLLLGLPGCNGVGRECLVCCVKLVKCVLIQLSVMWHNALLQTVQCGGAECWETVTGLNWLQCGGEGLSNVLCGASEMCFGTVGCDDEHCYIADGAVRWRGILRDCYWA